MPEITFNKIIVKERRTGGEPAVSITAPDYKEAVLEPALHGRIGSWKIRGMEYVSAAGERSGDSRLLDALPAGGFSPAKCRLFPFREKKSARQREMTHSAGNCIICLPGKVSWKKQW